MILTKELVNKVDDNLKKHKSLKISGCLCESCGKFYTFPQEGAALFGAVKKCGGVR